MTHIADGQVKRVAHVNFGGVEPFHSEVVNIEGFEFGAIDYEAANLQSSDGLCTNRECAHSDCADCSGRNGYPAEAQRFGAKEIPHASPHARVSDRTASAGLAGAGTHWPRDPEELRMVSAVGLDPRPMP
jgi:hypothetical protein